MAADIPDGFSEVARNVFVGKGEVVVCGEPPDTEHLADDNDPRHHNCDAMGCGTFSHVIYRAKLADAADLDRLTREKQEAEQDRDAFRASAVSADEAFQQCAAALNDAESMTSPSPEPRCQRASILDNGRLCGLPASDSIHGPCCNSEDCDYYGECHAFVAPQEPATPRCNQSDTEGLCLDGCRQRGYCYKYPPRAAAVGDTETPPAPTPLCPSCGNPLAHALTICSNPFHRRAPLDSEPREPTLYVPFEEDPDFALHAAEAEVKQLRADLATHTRSLAALREAVKEFVVADAESLSAKDDAYPAAEARYLAAITALRATLSETQPND